jgi:hypothetical protein
MQPGRKITSKQLTLLFLVLILGPVGFGLFLFSVTRKMAEPKLPALVRLETMWITSQDTDQGPRLVPCVSIKNPTDSGWNNLSIGLNEQFYAGEPKGISSGSVVSVPLEAFIARNGSASFPVGNRDIKLITVFAQIPSGARGVSKYSIPMKLKADEPSTKNDRDNQKWLHPD